MEAITAGRNKYVPKKSTFFYSSVGNQKKKKKRKIEVPVPKYLAFIYLHF